METFQPYLNYVAIGVGSILVVLLLFWVMLATRIMALTKGIPETISRFFLLIVDNNIDDAYQQMTTPQYQQRTSKKDFLKFIKANKFRQYQRTLLSIPKDEGDKRSIEVTLVTTTGQEIPLSVDLVRQEKNWKIDKLTQGHFSNQ